MNEAEIAAQLQQNVAPVAEPDEVPAPTAPVTDEPNQARTAASGDLDEITQFKLHDFFGEPYRQSDETKRQQLAYIYGQVAEMVDSQDYGLVIAKMRDLEQVAGLAHTQDRLYKLYQWLKLNNIRKSIDLQMGAMSGS